MISRRQLPELQAFTQVAVAKEDQPHYLKVIAKPGVDVGPMVRHGLGIIAARLRPAGHRHDHGVITAVRTYESPIDRAFEDGGFRFIGLREEPLENPLNRFAKRAVDFAIALPVMLVVFPVLALIVFIAQLMR